LSLMAGSKYFTLVDIENAYWNIPIQEQDKDKTGFITPFGSFLGRTARPVRKTEPHRHL
jgi:hypothetical protein